MSKDKNTPVLTRRKTHGSSSLKSTLPAEYLSKLNKSLTFNDKVVSLVNSIISELGPENGHSVSTRGVKKGKTPFTDSTEISLGRFLGKYELSYRTTTDGCALTKVSSKSNTTKFLRLSSIISFFRKK